jgi:hypothetical protein
MARLQIILPNRLLARWLQCVLMDEEHQPELRGWLPRAGEIGRERGSGRFHAPARSEGKEEAEDGGGARPPGVRQKKSVAGCAVAGWRRPPRWWSQCSVCVNLGRHGAG